MKLFKKNQVIIYVIALMLMTAGYLNYTTNNSSVETSIQMESNDDMQLADIGDATLVSSNITSENGENITGDEKQNVQANNQNTTSNNSIANNEINNQNITNSDSITNDNNFNDIVQVNSNSNDEYFVKSKLERDTMYSQMLETYEKVLNSNNALETQKQSATQEITKINETKNSIMICENLIETKGFKNSVIFVNGESISVIIGTDEMKQEQVAQIQNIISREFNANIENIHISTK